MTAEGIYFLDADVPGIPPPPVLRFYAFASGGLRAIAPAYLSVGNAPCVMDYIRMPHITSFNMAILKHFPIHEQVRLAFRAKMYGALNHVYFQTNANNFTAYTGLTYSGTLIQGVTLPTVTTNMCKRPTRISGRTSAAIGRYSWA